MGSDLPQNRNCTMGLYTYGGQVIGTDLKAAVDKLNELHFDGSIRLVMRESLDLKMMKARKNGPRPRKGTGRRLVLPPRMNAIGYVGATVHWARYLSTNLDGLALRGGKLSANGFTTSGYQLLLNRSGRKPDLSPLFVRVSDSIVINPDLRHAHTSYLAMRERLDREEGGLFILQVEDAIKLKTLTRKRTAKAPVRLAPGGGLGVWIECAKNGRVTRSRDSRRPVGCAAPWRKLDGWSRSAIGTPFESTRQMTRGSGQVSSFLSDKVMRVLARVIPIMDEFKYPHLKYKGLARYGSQK